jgi:hypothetical protein
MEVTKTKTTKILLWIVYFIILLLPCLEIALRIVGGKPYYNSNYEISCTPNNAFVGDSLLGIKLNDGDYSITLNKKVTFKTKHNNGLRSSISIQDNDSLPAVIYLGCSFTYGYGVNNDETFASLSQKDFSFYQFKNYGVPGYGTVQNLIQLQTVINSGQIPKLVVLNFSGHHFERNAMLPSYRKALKIGFQRALHSSESLMNTSYFPYNSGNSKLKMEYVQWNNIYNNWIGRETFASINWLQTMVDNHNTRKIDLIQNTLPVIEEIKQLCDAHQIDFLLVYLDTVSLSTELSNITRDMGYNQVMINFDFQDLSITNLPHDSHPNKSGHQFIYNSIRVKLSEILD